MRIDLNKMLRNGFYLSLLGFINLFIGRLIVMNYPKLVIIELVIGLVCITFGFAQMMISLALELKLED